MNKKLIVVVDADAIIALVNSSDQHHPLATKISQSLIEQEAQVFYPITAILEASAFIQRVLNNSVAAYEMTKLIAEPDSEVLETNKQTLINALKFFDPQSSKKNILFDCIIAATAQEKHVDAVFSFDKFYLKSGFKLASDLQV